MPGELWADRLTVAPILRYSRTSPDPFRIQVERLIVHPIRLGEHQVVLIDSELICQPGVCKVPRIGLPARRDGEIGHSRHCATRSRPPAPLRMRSELERLAVAPMINPDG